MSIDHQDSLEQTACLPIPVNPAGFNPHTVLPLGLTTEHVRAAMTDFLNLLGYINQELYRRKIERLESILMPANFSSVVGEFMGASIPKYCATLIKNNFHNGHPDLIPPGIHPNNAVQHHTVGIEIKASRYLKGWQGHNAEDCWLMVFAFDSNGPTDKMEEIPPRPFRFHQVLGAQIAQTDWNFAGRKEGSRRTPTASVTETGYQKMRGNWIYIDPSPPPPPPLGKSEREKKEAIKAQRARKKTESNLTEDLQHRLFGE